MTSGAFGRRPAATRRRALRGGLTAFVSAAMLWSAGACVDLGPETELERLEEQLARWRSVRPARYRLALLRQCFCVEEARGPVVVEVVGDSVVDRRYLRSGDPVPEAFAPWFPDVDGLFAFMRDALERDPAEFLAQYDQATGVPVEVFIDFDAGVADEELGYSLLAPVEALPSGR